MIGIHGVLDALEQRPRGTVLRRHEPTELEADAMVLVHHAAVRERLHAFRQRQTEQARQMVLPVQASACTVGSSMACRSLRGLLTFSSVMA